MKSFNAFKFTLLVAASALIIVPSCSKDRDGQIAGTGTDTEDRSTTTTKAIAERECSKTMTEVTSDGLYDFLQPDESLDGLEPPVTYCLTFSASNPSFRLEFEADAGIFFTTFRKNSSIEVLLSKKTSTSIEIIYEDGYGLVQIKGSKNAGSTGPITAKVKYYNFPSYEEAMREAVEEAREKCDQDDEDDWTVAECNGHGAPRPWWDDPYYTDTQTRVEKAQEILSDSSKTSVLGKITY